MVMGVLVRMHVYVCMRVRVGMDMSVRPRLDARLDRPHYAMATKDHSQHPHTHTRTHTHLDEEDLKRVLRRELFGSKQICRDVLLLDWQTNGPHDAM